MASLGVSEMLGTPLNFRAVSRSSAPLASNPATFKTVALFSKKKPAPPPKAKTVSAANDELAKWYGTFLLPSASLSILLCISIFYRYFTLIMTLVFQVLTGESSCLMVFWTDQRSQST